MTVVTTKEQAEVVLKALYSDQSRKAFHACEWRPATHIPSPPPFSPPPLTLATGDTEVMRIELKDVGPVGNGHMTCFSMYSGPDFDYGFGKGQSLFVDCLDASRDLLPMFKDWFEDEDFKKVWHNYGFDRHIMFNEEIDCKGFAGDTMHMARLEDSSRGKFGGGGGGYSLAALTEDLLGRAKVSRGHRGEGGRVRGLANERRVTRSVYGTRSFQVHFIFPLTQAPRRRYP